MSLTNLGAGLETVTWTINTILTSIGSDRRIRQLVHDEIDAAQNKENKLGPGSPDAPVPYEEAAAASLPYLQACMKEVMRLYPNLGVSMDRVVPASHANGQGLTIDGYNLPPGTVVGTNVWVKARDTSIFGPDADALRPERWLEASKSELSTMMVHDLAFGSVGRSCPGRHMAWVIMSKTLATLFRDFEVEVLNERDGPPGPGGRKWVWKTTFPSRVEGAEVAFLPRRRR